jgi:hypothetical protein
VRMTSERIITRNSKDGGVRARANPARLSRAIEPDVSGDARAKSEDSYIDLGPGGSKVDASGRVVF